MGLLTIGIGAFLIIDDNFSKKNNSNNANVENDKEPGVLLREAYDIFEISNEMNGYSISYLLSGEYGDKKYYDFISIQNYMDKTYRISDGAIDAEGNINLEFDEYYIIDGITYMKKNDKFYKIDEEIAYNNLEIYLNGLINAKNIIKSKRKIDGNEYDEYKFVVDLNVMKETLSISSASDIILEKDVECNALINESGILWKLEYDLAKALDSEIPFSLTLIFHSLGGSIDYEVDNENHLVIPKDN